MKLFLFKPNYASDKVNKIEQCNDSKQANN